MLGAIFLLTFFGCGAAGFLIFTLVARAGKKIWPVWLGGMGAILFGAYVVGGIWASHNLGGLGVGGIFLLGWAGAGLVSWGLAALMVGAISSMK